MIYIDLRWKNLSTFRWGNVQRPRWLCWLNHGPTCCLSCSLCSGALYPMETLTLLQQEFCNRNSLWCLQLDHLQPPPSVQKEEKENRRRQNLPHCWWGRKLVQPPWKTVWRFLENTKMRVTTWSSSPTPGRTPREKRGPKGYLDPSVHHSTVYNSQVMEASQRPSAEEWVRKMWCTYSKECYSEQKNSICGNMDGLVRIILNQVRQRQIYNITYMWNLKYDTNELI